MIKAYQERTSPKRHRFGEVLIISIQNFDNISPFSSVAAIKLCSFVIVIEDFDDTNLGIYFD